MKLKQAILYLYHLRRWLLFCGLIGSTLLNVYLFQVAHQYYLALNGTRLDPLGLLYPARDNISTALTNTAQLTAGPAEAFPYAGITGYGQRYVYRPTPVIDTTPRWAFWRKRNLAADGHIELR